MKAEKEKSRKTKAAGNAGNRRYVAMPLSLNFWHTCPIKHQNCDRVLYPRDSVGPAHQPFQNLRLFIIPPAEVAATRAMLSRIPRVSYASRLLKRRYATKSSKANTTISTVTSPSSFWAQTFKKVTGSFTIPHDSQD